MARKPKLTPEQRELFRVVNRAVYCNPFSPERLEVDRKMAGYLGGESTQEIATLAIERVAASVKELERNNLADLTLWRGEDFELLRTLFIFDVFNKFSSDFIQLIHDQLSAGEASAHVWFGREALGILEKRGYSEELANRFFSMMYQLWRGFYFIDRKLIGVCPSMRQLRYQLWNNVFTNDIEWYGLYLWERMEDFSTLLLGETGTGKGSAASAIGMSAYVPYDPRRRKFEESFAANFIAINPSQFPETLIESELFGHRKGSFTGAIEHHEGVFSRCSRYGAIFLDEIGDLSQQLQIKLLNVVQDRAFTKVGSHEKLRFRGRVMAATNQPLDELRRAGIFRDDLYYRLCSNTIRLPSLRERFREDPREMELLLHHVVTKMLGEERPAIEQAVKEVIARDLGPDYAWPGNVREFEQAVRSAILAHSYRPSTSEEARDLQGRLISGIDRGDMSIEELNDWYCALLYQRHGSYEKAAKHAGVDWRTVRKHVRAVLEKAPEETGDDPLSALKKLFTGG